MVVSGGLRGFHGVSEAHEGVSIGFSAVLGEIPLKYH